MTTSLTSLARPAATALPASAPSDTWAGLTGDDATRIAAAIAATHAESTRKAYAFA